MWWEDSMTEDGCCVWCGDIGDNVYRAEAAAQWAECLASMLEAPDMCP